MAEREVYRLTLFVPGAPASEEAWAAALAPGGLTLTDGALRGAPLEAPVPVDFVPNDGAFGDAFSFGTVPPEGVAAIDAAPSALVLSLTLDLATGRAAIVSVVERLRDAGALAVRIEESKLGWAIERWLEIFGSDDDPWAWHRGAVAFLHEDGALQSCGMHAFSLPDVLIPVDGDPAELQHFASVLNVYQIAEDPLLVSGQTFAPDAETPRRVVERWPDAGYPANHPCHNPYGVWRLGPPGGEARPVQEVVPVFVPALVATLTMLEEQAGAPLTRERVEEIRDECPCVTMEQRQLQSMERSRGYADIDPDLAWEQWQVVRATRG